MGKDFQKKTDLTTPIAQLREEYRAFSKERNWERYHDPKSVSLSIVLEAAELMELFQWDDADQSKVKLKDPEIKQKAKHELADILNYIFNFANQADIDLTQAFFEKIELARKKYPVELVSQDLENYQKIKTEYRKNRK